jgi:hypothetical protein
VDHAVTVRQLVTPAPGEAPGPATEPAATRAEP